MEKKRSLTEPFYYPGNAVGCLLIHGFSASPSEMFFLGERLAACGFTIKGVRLSGHGSTSEEMAKYRWKDWVGDAEKGVKQLREVCESVVAVGLSMGGLLALHLAAARQVDGVVSLNAPMVFQDGRIRYVRLFRHFIPYINKPQPKDDPFRFSYNTVPTACLYSLHKAIYEVRRELNRIVCPALLMQSVNDDTVLPVSVEIIEQGIGSKQKEVALWHNSDHILTMGPEKEAVAYKTGEFIGRISGHPVPKIG